MWAICSFALGGRQTWNLLLVVMRLAPRLAGDSWPLPSGGYWGLNKRAVILGVPGITLGFSCLYTEAAQLRGAGFFDHGLLAASAGASRLVFGQLDGAVTATLATCA